jgi:nitrogen fixation protein
LQVVDVVIEYDVDTAGGNILLDSLTVFVRIRRVEEHRVRVDNRDLLAGERVLDLSSIF